MLVACTNAKSMGEMCTQLKVRTIRTDALAITETWLKPVEWKIVQSCTGSSL